MKDSPEAVYLYIPLMKELNMSWNEIKNTPNIELRGLARALASHSLVHAFDGYTPDDIGDLAKKKPQVRSDYARSMALKALLEEKAGMKRKVLTFRDVVG
tara:strand:+ start:548 stop:847 length:300 start_codon:yes stop_codon:yes gene_type:complete